MVLNQQPPVKKYQEPVLPINIYFGSSTPAKMTKMSPAQTQDAKSMQPDEALLNAMGSVKDDEISFAEAEAIINGDNDNPMTSDSTQIDNESKETTDISEKMPVENCNGITATTVDDTDNDSNVVMTTTEIHSKKQPDITSVEVNVNNKRVMPTKSQPVITDSNSSKTPEIPTDQNHDIFTPDTIKTDTNKKVNGEKKVAKKLGTVTGFGINDDRLPFNVCCNILKNFK